MVSPRKVYIYIAVFLIVFSTDTFVVFANINKYPKVFFQLLLLLMLVTLLLISKFKLSKRLIFYWILQSFLMVLGMIVNNDYGKGTIFKIFLILLSAVFCTVIDFDDFKDSFVEIMSLICFFSLIVYVLSPIVLQNVSHLPVITNINGEQIVCFGLTNVHIKFDGITRNWGPFWEPGVYAIYLCVALLFSLNDLSKISVKPIILVLGILSTLSTTGYIVLLLIIFEFLVRKSIYVNNKKTINNIKFIILVLGFLLFLFVILNNNLRSLVFGKLSNKNYEYLSTMSRMISVIGNLIVFFQHPLLGVGPTNLSDIYNMYLANIGYNTFFSNTNGFLMHFSVYGVFIGSIMVWGYYKLAANLSISFRSEVLIFIIFVSMLFAEPLLTSVLFNIFIFYGICGCTKENSQVLSQKGDETLN